MAVIPFFNPASQSACASVESALSAREDTILVKRAEVLARIDSGLEELYKAAEVVDMLRAPELYDVELAEGRDGRDVAARLDTAIRDARSAYAELQMRFTGEGAR